MFWKRSYCTIKTAADFRKISLQVFILSIGVQVWRWWFIQKICKQPNTNWRSRRLFSIFWKFILYYVLNMFKYLLFLLRHYVNHWNIKASAEFRYLIVRSFILLIATQAWIWFVVKICKQPYEDHFFDLFDFFYSLYYTTDKIC